MRTRLVLLTAAFCQAGPTGSVYRWDDGVSDLSLGCAGDNHCWAVWLNLFTAQPGALTITDIELAYGSKFNSGFAPRNGTPVTVYLWTDPARPAIPRTPSCSAASPPPWPTWTQTSATSSPSRPSR